MAGTVPLISSGVAGPLGILHLPRFWQKVVLSAKGKLASDYPECGKGFDQMVLDALGLDRAATLKYLKEKVPTYPAFEAWIVQQKGGKPDKAKVDAHNKAVRGYNHGDDTRKSILAAAGIKDDGTVLDAVTLNQLEDWTEFHKSL